MVNGDLPVGSSRSSAVRATGSDARPHYGVWLLAFAMLVLGFLAGTYRQNIMAAILPVFGVPASAETLDTAQLQRTYQALVANFDGMLDTEALINGASRGMVAAAGDPYTVFLDSSEAKEFEDSLSGSIGGGIGTQIGLQDGKVTVVKVLSATPAEQAGVLAGDQIVAINGESTENFTTEKTVQKIRGDVGTTVKLELRRGSEMLEKTITRQEISTPSVESERRGTVGLITVSRFDQDTGSRIRQAAETLKGQGATAFIVDVRGNGGGFLTAAQDAAGVWLNDKVVVSERTGGKETEVLRTGNKALLAGVPTVVLVDGDTASASEIVAGALKDHGAATIIGTETFGKGTVQRLVTLANGAMLKVTVARWYTPNGQNLSEKGITPDKMVERSDDDIKAQRDPQLDAALSLLAG